MKPEFQEDYLSKHVDPLVDMHQGFPFEQVYRDVDGEQPPHDATAERHEAQLADLARVLDFPLVPLGEEDHPNQYNLSLAEKVGRRAIVMAWVVNPALVGGSSLTNLAKRLGVSVPILSAIASEVTRTFGIENRAQSHDHFKRVRDRKVEAFKAAA